MSISKMKAAPISSAKTPGKVDIKQALADLRNQGLSFSDCVAEFGVDRDENPYARAAHENHTSDGDLEFDDPIVVSEGDPDGAYVMCWKFIYKDDAGIGEDEEEGEEESSN